MNVKECFLDGKLRKVYLFTGVDGEFGVCPNMNVLRDSTKGTNGLIVVHKMLLVRIGQGVFNIIFYDEDAFLCFRGYAVNNGWNVVGGEFVDKKGDTLFYLILKNEWIDID